MDRYFNQTFAWLRDRHPELVVSATESWHSYNFHLSPELVDELKRQMDRVFGRTWETRVRFQPEMNTEEIDAFVQGSELPVQGRKRCLSIASRLNVMPDGGVTTCKLFPEFRVGGLTGSSVEDVWHGLVAKRTRSALSKGLTPICSKCVQLYFPSA